MTDPNKPDQELSGDDWSEALAAQADADAAGTTDDSSADDPWAEALAQQAGAETTAGDSVQSAGEQVFRPLDAAADKRPPRDLEMVMDIPVKFTVELGRTRITIKQLLELTQGSVVELDGLAGEPMDILINGYLIAQGEVVVVEDRYGIRITEIITPSERVQKLNR
ncbi:flagellar motor switch protein FliN [Parahaliea aestuarii]|uniref:Flagellar motor switch protein FliN n=1 Tax=Parahaliea aestuarii TaxID=1852021 RepID=A0A5C9A1P0_9GAMM|nr:flagellar motor switch protein FliN [Parahaliea aestuarii]TXS94783.1 flagellar motor switch protein FliN [Parahaliea aestuarii]